MERYWVGRAKRLALRVNVGWWLSAFLPVFVLLATFCAGLILVIRRSGGDAAAWVPWVVALHLGAAVGAWVYVRKRFFTVEDALAYLDLRLGLHSRLASAREGVGAWPARDTRSEALGFRAGRTAPPLLLAASLLGAALVIPVPVEPPPRPTVAEPMTWSKVEETLAALQEAPVEEATLEEWSRRLEELRAQPNEEWFEHGSLEAGDHLRQQLAESMAQLQRDMAETEAMLQEMERLAELGEGSEALSEEWKQAMRDLELGQLPLDAQLRQQLAELDPKDARTLSKEQLEALQMAIREGRVQIAEAGEEGEGEGVGEGEALVGLMPGQGGISRGPGDAELSYRKDGAGLSPTAPENIASGDLERVGLGDVVGLSSKEHEIDTSVRRPTESGAAKAHGHGGDAVWRARLDPDEQAFLERYFK